MNRKKEERKKEKRGEKENMNRRKTKRQSVKEGQKIKKASLEETWKRKFKKTKKQKQN